MEDSKKIQYYIYTLWIHLLIVVVFFFTLFSVSQSNSSVNFENGNNLRNRNITRIYKSQHSFENVVEEAEVGKPGTKLVIPNWDFSGNISLVNNQPIRLYSTGSIWNSHNVSMKNWEFQLQFQTHKEEKEEKEDKIEFEQGHGLVFWYTKEKNPQGLFAASSRPLDGLVILIQVYRDNYKIRHSLMSVMINNIAKGHFEEFDLRVDGCWGHNLRGPDSSQDLPSWLKIRYENNCLTVSTKLPTRETKSGEGQDSSPDDGIWATCFRGLVDISLPSNYFFGLTPFPFQKMSDVKNLTLSRNYLDIHQISTFELDIPKGVKSACAQQVEVRNDFAMELALKHLLVRCVGFLVFVGFCIAGFLRAYTIPYDSRNVERVLY